ncbi:response regulator [Flavobacterium sp. GA093]|uniref:Response regulator n=1 Tax=Flavobacterium hydrocarbonoxydans TaxID=2683249 RepID=A0A6I4NMG3_9FLAO|nr:response regulator [Flavobacterium hydrocarbonoxydans]MWB94102.1 response regulator [Flavobacterium hydrocarbonoxydans]
MKKQTILLIDDDPDDAEIFSEAIKSLNQDIEIEIYNNSLTALDNLKSSATLPDFIFLDMQMPHLNGNQFLDEIANTHNLANITVVIYSSYSQASLYELVISTRKVILLTKPNSMGELIQNLKTIL